MAPGWAPDPLLDPCHREIPSSYSVRISLGGTVSPPVPTHL